MKVSDYIPNLYKNNIDILNIINSEEIELENNLKPGIENRFLDTFANKATENGISKFENLFGIEPNYYTESLEFRRERVMSRLISNVPYTERYLINKFNSILGENNWSYNLDYNKYTLEVRSLTPGKGWYQELLNFLTEIIPCNISWSIVLYAATWGIVKDTFRTWDDINEMTWQELMDGEWTLTKGREINE